jgi:L-threonylcarbamoyladenylate synthase
MLNSLVLKISPLAEKLIEHFWPGPLTLVLPAREDIPRPLVSSTGAIGVRISSQPIANKIVRLLGRPITATSANPSGQPGAQTLAQARDYFSGKIEVFIDGGELNSKTASTVAAVTENKITIIRAGEIGKDELQILVGKGIDVE